MCASKSKATSLVKGSCASLVKSSSKASQASSDSSHLASAAVKALWSGTGDGTYVQMMKTKLESHPDYKESDEIIRLDAARDLISEERLYSHFSHLIEGVLVEVVTEATKYDNSELAHSLERKREKEAQQIRYDHLAKLNIRVLLRNIDLSSQVPGTVRLSKVFGMEYGDKHAGILIGNVLLEWGTESVIIPKISAEGVFQFEGSLEEDGKYYEQIAKRRPQLDDRLKTHQEELTHLFFTAEKSKDNIRKIIKIIVKYNKRCYYSLAYRNCQHFVKEVLSVIGIDPAKFIPEDEMYLKHYIKGDKLTVPNSFKSHEDIDSYITKHNLPKLSIHDLKHLNTVYEHFHDKNGRCTYPSCQLRNVTTMLSSKQS